MGKKLIFGVIILIVLFILFISIFTVTSHQTYTNQYISFQYPAGWHTEDISMGSVSVYAGSKGDLNSEYFTVTPYGHNTKNKIFRFIHDFNRENDSLASNTNQSMIETGNINGGYYTFYGDHSNKTKNRQFLVFIQNDTGVLVSGYIKDPSILLNVISTFNLKI